MQSSKDPARAGCEDSSGTLAKSSKLPALLPEGSKDHDIIHACAITKECKPEEVQPRSPQNALLCAAVTCEDVTPQLIAEQARPEKQQTLSISIQPASAGTSHGLEPEKPEGSIAITVDSDTQEALHFADTAARNGFVRKVFGLVSLQLLVTVGIVCICMFVPPMTQYLKATSWPFWTSLGLMILVYIVILAAGKARQMWPYDLIMLMSFTIVVGTLLGTLSALYSIPAVLIALGITSVNVIFITVIAFDPKVDATSWGMMLGGLSLAFITLLILGLVWHIKWWQALLSGLGSLLFSAFMLHDMQLIIGGKHKKYSISPDEYICAALILYMDIVNVFTWILGGSGAASS